VTLHVYAQDQWHDQAFIVGTKEDLVKLQAAVGLAIEHGMTAWTFFANDGEGYDLVIRRVDELTAGRLAVPYTNEVAAEREGSERLRPWELGEKNLPEKG